MEKSINRSLGITKIIKFHKYIYMHTYDIYNIYMVQKLQQP